MAVATYEDVAVAAGRPISDPAEIARVDYWLAAAEMQIAARLGDVTLLSPTALRYVEAEAVSMRLSNPDGYQYEAIDDYRYGRPAESRRVTIIDEWWALLSPTTSSSAYTIAVSSPLDLP